MTTPTILLAALVQNLIVGLLCVAAAGVAGVAAFFYLRAKNREAIDPALSAGIPQSSNGLGEMRELTSRIEDIVLQQQDNGETQRQHLSRKIDAVKESVESQHHAVTGLRQELRHEVQKRDAELHEIRTQIEAVREGVALPPAQWTELPAAQLGAPEAEGPFMPLTFESDDASGDDLAFTPFEDVTFSEGSDASPPLDASGDSLFAARGFEEASFDDDDSATPGPFLFTIDPTPSFEEADFSSGNSGFDEAPAFSFEEMPDPLSFSEAEAPFEQDASPLAFASEEDGSAFEPMAFSFEEDAEAPLAPGELAGLSALNDPDPLGFEDTTPIVFETVEPEAFGSQTFEPEAVVSVDEFIQSPTPKDESPAVYVDVPAAGAPDTTEDAEPRAAASFEEAPSADAPHEIAEPVAYDTAPEVEAEEPAFDAPMSVSNDDAEASVEVEQAEPAGTFEIVSFLAPEAEETAPEAETPAHSFESAEAPASRIRADRHAHSGAAMASGGSAPPFSPAEPPVFEASVEVEEPEPSQTAWISRPERDEPVETIGGIEIEKIGDVPSTPPQAEAAAAAEVFEPAIEMPALVAETPAPAIEVPETASIEAEAPREEVPSMSFPDMVASTPQEVEMEFAAPEAIPEDAATQDDDFPAPVVANELADEPSFDFGIDIDAEMALAEAHGAPLAESFEEQDAPAAERDEPSPKLEIGSPESMVISADSFVSAPPPKPRPAVVTPEAPVTPAAMEAAASAPEAREPDEVPVEEEVVPPFVAPEGAEDLTAISSVDEETQRMLYMAGVLTLDEIARWGRTEARRISSEVGVSEETIMHQWVFEAQAALFDRFSR